MSLTPIALEIDQGDDEVIDIQVKKPDLSAVDLSSCKLMFWIKENAGDSDAAVLLSKSTDTNEGITVTNVAGGIAEVEIAHIDTASFTASQTGRQLNWALQVIDVASKITTLAKGTIVVNRDLIAAIT